MRIRFRVLSFTYSGDNGLRGEEGSSVVQEIDTIVEEGVSLELEVDAIVKEGSKLRWREN